MEKTAMQELIEQLQTQNKAYYEKCKKAKGTDKNTLNDGMAVITLSIIKAQNLLPKERQQIIDAYKNGFYAGCYQPLFDNMPEDYFTQTYTQK